MDVSLPFADDPISSTIDFHIFIQLGWNNLGDCDIDLWQKKQMPYYHLGIWNGWCCNYLDTADASEIFRTIWDTVVMNPCQTIDHQELYSHKPSTNINQQWNPLNVERYSPNTQPSTVVFPCWKRYVHGWWTTLCTPRDVSKMYLCY